MTLTIKQRHDMYVRMMKEIEAGYDIDYWGFCGLWEYITNEYPYIQVSGYYLSDVLPELYANRTKYASFWFYPGDRIPALRSCIEETSKLLTHDPTTGTDRAQYQDQ